MPWGYTLGEKDFYPTPAWVTELLLDRFPPPAGRIVEPCAGAGAIVGELVRRGHGVWANEIGDGYRDSLVSLIGEHNVSIGDWYDVDRVPDGCTSLITNPPFSLLPDFAVHCLSMGLEYVALIMPIGVLFSEERAGFNRKYRPSGMINLVHRPWPNVRDVSWFVWEAGKEPMPMFSA